MEESLEITRYVPTIFPSFNRAIVLKGAPLGCVWTVHGEYAGGKSTMTIGLLKSFIEGGHLGALIDAEHATSKTWLLQLGIDPSSFLYYRPDTMEDATDMIDSLVANFDEGRKDGTIPKDKGMIIILDSINKLTPKSEWERFKKEGSDALDKGLARYRGLLLQSWYDHMTPIIGKRDIALVCIAQEREIQTKNIYDPSFKVKGCQGALFDSFVQLRVLKGEKLWLEKGSGKVKKKILVGMGHRFIVFKNKVGFPNETGTFFTSNGKGFIPIGFNHAKTAIDEAIMRGGIIEQNGGWYAWHGNKWNGENAFICALHEDPDLLGDLQLELDNSIDTFFFSNSTQQYKSETNE
jgi:recombination protein RecA